MLKILSIVTICYNEVTRIEATILSVLNQTFKEYQFVVIDGASTDGTVNVIKKYKDKIDIFISEPDKGIYNAMNKSINYCKGDYIYFLNSGDVFYSKTTLEKIISHQLEGDFIYGNIGIKETSGEEWVLEMPKNLTKPFLMKKTIPHQATFTKKKLFNKIGKYDEKFKIAADYKFSLQSIYHEKCKLQYVSETFALFDNSGFGTVNVELRQHEKRKIQFQIFGLFDFVLTILKKWKNKFNRI